jgi:hypothetical protein
MFKNIIIVILILILGALLFTNEDMIKNLWKSESAAQHATPSTAQATPPKQQSKINDPLQSSKTLRLVENSPLPITSMRTPPADHLQAHQSSLSDPPRPSRYLQERYTLNEESFSNMSSRAYMFDTALKKQEVDIRKVVHPGKCQWIAIASLEDKESAQFFKMLVVLYTHYHDCDRIQVLTDAPSTFAEREHKKELNILFGQLSKFGVRSKARLKRYFTTRDSTEQTLTNLAELINAPQINSKALTTKPLLLYLKEGRLKNFWTSDVQDNYQEFVNLLNHFKN